MPSLARGQTNTPSILNWFLTVNGTLTDLYSVGFQIWDISGGLPGTQIYPATLGTWQDVTDNDGHYSVGHYYAWDSDNEEGWTPGLAENLGTHRVLWRWKASLAAPYQAGQEDFEILVQSAGGSADTYISLLDIRNEGLGQTDFPDTTVLASISLWQEVIDRACRQWFNARSLTICVDGNDSDTLHFGVPIISIDYLKLNGRDDEFDTGLYRIYSDRNFLVDRGNPCIKLLGPDYHRDIYLDPMVTGRLKFHKGRQNQEIKGIFGYVESDGSTPKLIKRALTRLVVEKLTRPIYPTPGSVIAPSPSVLGSILEEKTDGHAILYAPPGGQFERRRVGLSGITQDPEILDTFRLYKAPLGVATPAHWSY